MTASENDGPDKQTTGNDTREKVSIDEDEIDLMDYCFVLWKRKFFILLASVLPAVAVGLVMFLGPRDYKIRYTYDMGLSEKAFQILQRTFHSTENIKRITHALQPLNINACAEKTTELGTAKTLNRSVSFEFLPLHDDMIEPSKMKAYKPAAREGILIMQVATPSKEHLREIALICRNNFEQVLPLYSVRRELNRKIVNLKENLADIEETRYTLSLELERKKATLEKLRHSGSEDSAALPGEITVQFNNIGENVAFLPLAYQVQAAETQIINLQETIRANKEEYDYYTDLLNLNGTLLSHVEKAISSDDTLGQFRVFLADTLSAYTEEAQQPLRDYLNAYIKRLENTTANIIPLVEQPRVYASPKDIVKKSGLAFATALMLSVFAAFLLEGLKKN